MKPAIAIVVMLAACGGGSSSAPKESTPKETPPREEAPEPERTGVMECDALIARTYCTWSKSGDAVSPEAKQAFADAIPQWREALQDEASRQAVIDACRMSLDGGYPGYSAMGCWMVGDDYDAYVPAEPPPEDDPPEELDYTFASTGNAECDSLVTKTMCVYAKTPDMPVEAIKAFQEGIKAWTESLKNDATRQATIDACLMSLDGAEAAFEAMGC